MSIDQAKPFIAIRPWLRAGLLRHLSPKACRILFLVIDHCHKDGYSYPSARLLAEESGHSRTHVYEALRELEGFGVLERKPGAEGQTRFPGRNHPGPVWHWVGTLDEATKARLNRKRPRRRGWGDANRFQSQEMSQVQGRLSPGEMSQVQGHLEAERCPKLSPQDVPSRALQDVPSRAPEMSQVQGHVESLKSEKRRVSEETPPHPPQGGMPVPEQVRAGLADGLGSGKRNGNGATKAAERMRESMRLLLQAELQQGHGLKPLTFWESWFPKQYPREVLHEVYAEVKLALQESG